jgi:hypothetical protein
VLLHRSNIGILGLQVKFALSEESPAVAGGAFDF